MFPKGNVDEDALFWGKPAEGTQVLLQPRTPGLQDEINYKLILLISTGADYESTLHGGFFPPRHPELHPGRPFLLCLSCLWLQVQSSGVPSFLGTALKKWLGHREREQKEQSDSNNLTEGSTTSTEQKAHG